MEILIHFVQVPFVLGEAGVSDIVVPNFDGSRHPLPLLTVFQQKQLFKPNPYTFLQKLIGHDYPVSAMQVLRVFTLTVLLCLSQCFQLFALVFIDFCYEFHNGIFVFWL